MRPAHYLILFTLAVLLVSCIGDDLIEDFVQPEIRINNSIDSLELGTTFQLEVDVFNNVGKKDDAILVTWTSDQPMVISVTENGLATANALGEATLTANANTSEGLITETIRIVVGQSTSSNMTSLRGGTIKTTSSYVLEGDFKLEAVDGKLILTIDENYMATSALPGLYLYLSNNPRSIAEAFEVSVVDVFSGAHMYEIEGVDIAAFDYLLYYCKPFNVKVGDAEIMDLN